MTMVASAVFFGRAGSGGRGWRGGRRGSRRTGFQFQFNLAEPQRLAGLQNAFGDLFAIDERAVRRIKVFDDDITAAQQHFAMMAGDGRLGDLKTGYPRRGQSWCDPRSARVRGRSGPESE